VVLIESEELPEPPAIDAGLKRQDAPAGSPEQDKLTAALNPFNGAT
jgi:hypothetical protein